MHFLFVLLFFCACQPTSQEDLARVLICGRDAAHPWIYRVKVPRAWEHHAPEEALSDTTKPLCAFTVEQQIKITIHNFPSENMEQRIPPAAQINRWKRQFSQLDPASVATTPQAFSGYVGLLFEGSGTLNGSQQSVMGWSMQLAPQHYRTLTALDSPYRQDLRADFTIKAVGPSALIDRHRDEILRFARSFELIEAIPAKT